MDVRNEQGNELYPLPEELGDLDDLLNIEIQDNAIAPLPIQPNLGQAMQPNYVMQMIFGFNANQIGEVHQEGNHNDMVNRGMRVFGILLGLPLFLNLFLGRIPRMSQELQQQIKNYFPDKRRREKIKNKTEGWVIKEFLESVPNGFDSQRLNFLAVVMEHRHGLSSLILNQAGDRNTRIKI